ncbi:MAG: hypothetical protein NWQ13_06160 [Glaciimonas sp.]|nr:hypothetical protein [Glaciimonas sp.]
MAKETMAPNSMKMDSMQKKDEGMMDKKMPMKKDMNKDMSKDGMAKSEQKKMKKEHVERSIYSGNLY